MCTPGLLASAWEKGVTNALREWCFFAAAPSWQVETTRAAAESSTYPSVVCPQPPLTCLPRDDEQVSPSLSPGSFSSSVVLRGRRRQGRLVSVLRWGSQATAGGSGACRQGAKIKVRHLLQRSRKRRGICPMGDAQRGGGATQKSKGMRLMTVLRSPDNIRRDGARLL